MHKDIQSLNGKLAALSRFLSKGTERSLPFFKVFKSCTDKKNIQWTQEAVAALQEIKKFVETLPSLTTPIHGEVLMMYLAASTESINAALFARREKGEVPIYFVSRVLQGAELNYPTLEKLILALVHAARRLRRYFQAHTVAVLTNSSIKQALTNPEKSGRVAKWAIELGEHDIVKEVERKTDTKLEETKLICEWKLYTDGASSSDGSGAGLMLIDRKGKEYTYALCFKFETMNNEAEYKALLARIRIAQEMEIVNLTVFVDSQLLVNQVKGIYAAKQSAIRESIEEKEALQVETKEEESWMTPIHEYLLSGLLPEDPKESKKIRIKAPQYKLIKGSPYKKSFYTSWLRCIAPPKTNDVIKEIHEGSCGFNTDPRSMVVRITKKEYYWPSMHRDVLRIIQDYEKCKEQSVVKKREEIGAITAGNAWPFSH
ncbi:reverse transcriptase domain-containing protein [Tanacetum coccineum]